ncbi:glutamate receptor ionotropic, NMDA 2B isoform X2 [Anthonomus grandis grandis]|uniref:glutamate receptor ionotropic, NMDA 2B isoform X2 n=1 Tax=Anthonomus grandis grandis TaxID=2921223 RepID=UPI0021653484|nr:glutamate receptor ionotropic, NMDA 2B isoform X2 [Anthonomus grandis grandis]
MKMKLMMFAFNLLVASVVSGGPAWKEVQRGGGLKIGEKSKNASLSRGNGIKLGSSNRGLRSTTTTTTMVPEEEPQHVQHPPTSPAKNKIVHLNIGIVVPYKSFGVREYTKAITTTKTLIARKLNLFRTHDIQVHIVMKQMTPSPTAILKSLCKEFLNFNVSAILYLMNYEQYGRSTASAQYFLQLAGYLGIPVIAWNADNSGLERRASQSSLQLQLAPSLEHQTAAMLSILERYKWHQFSVVTSLIAGHDDFIQAVRERVVAMQDRFKFTILNAVLVAQRGDLAALVDSEARVMLLYCTKEEAIDILRAAGELHLTGENYVWVVTQSVIENGQQAPNDFPVGMLGVHFDTSSQSLVNEITTAIKVYAHGVDDFLADKANRGRSLTTHLSCEDEGAARWDTGDLFFKYLRNVSVDTEQGKPNLEFTPDGVLSACELKIMNLRPGVSKQNYWEEIGVWKSWGSEGLDIKDIVWPGNSHTPPQGVPEKFHLKITFLEEAPYIKLAPPDPVTGKCSMDRGVLCRVASDEAITEVDMSQAHRNGSFYQCCSGFCIDLLQKFSEELGFTYELVRVEDGKWGTNQNGKWNGLIADLVNRKTDMVLTSLTINAEREAVVDFSVPFMETGIAIVVAKRTGIISPTAFLEPFDAASWMLVGVVAIHASTFTIFLFEWLSPSGFNMKLAFANGVPSTAHRFSLFRTYWLVWAVLFQAAVHVDSPRGFTSRFMTNVWAMFAVVFLAIYTANLAAFMITREEFFEFTGIDDHRLCRPFSHKPTIKFGTIPWSHTDSTLAKYFKEMHSYMNQFNKTTVLNGVAAVLSGDMDAFIYDGTVLEYLTSQDEDCRLLTVGSWYAMTGYGLAFPRNSKYLKMFNKRLLDFRENGDLERLRRYWMTGVCRPGKQEHKSSDPLALEQFLSAFLLLMAGILLAALLLLLEHLYFKYIRKHLAKTDRGGCCALISLSMGKSLTFRGAVYEAQDIIRNHRCRDPICDTHLWKVKRELDVAQMRIKQLEKEMEVYGIKPPPTKRILVSGETTKARLRNLEPAEGGSCADLNGPTTTEIAEMETVL